MPFVLLNVQYLFLGEKYKKREKSLHDLEVLLNKYINNMNWYDW